MHPLQEKFQITVPGRIEDGEQWSSFKDNRDLRGLENWAPKTSGDQDPRKFNEMPPGMELENQCFSEQNAMPLALAGENDVSRDTNPDAMRDGFTKRRMKGTDDQYTGEHVDHFYGDAGGFVERNNYLDRE